MSVESKGRASGALVTRKNSRDTPTKSLLPTFALNSVDTHRSAVVLQARFITPIIPVAGRQDQKYSPQIRFPIYGRACTVALYSELVVPRTARNCR
jgi:hypothetical protein